MASAGASSTVSVGTSLARKKKAEAAALEQKLAEQEVACKRKELELVELKKRLEQEQQTVQKKFKLAGSRDQRVDVSTLKGTPSISQVGREMATAIRKRQERRKASLRERLNKHKIKLDNDVAHNRELRAEIEQRRRVRVHHLEALKIGGTQVEQSTNDISGMIVAAQRAYAERESCEMRQTEMKEELAKEAAQWQKTLAEYDAEMEALDEECRARDRELEELEKDCAAAVAVARRAEAEQERQLEHYASVKNRRLEYAHGLEQIFKTLHVGTVSKLLDAYTMTASKILSLWDKHGEQEQDLEKLEGEIKSLSDTRAAIVASNGDSNGVSASVPLLPAGLVGGGGARRGRGAKGPRLGMGAPQLGMKGGVLRNLSMREPGPALHPLPTRLDPSALS